MPYEEEEVAEPEEEYEEIDTSEYPANANPRALGWYTYWANEGGYSGTPPGYYLTQDTTIDPTKTYYRVITQEGAVTMSEHIAYSTYQTYLMYRTTTSGTYANLLPIKDYPDMIGDRATRS